MATKNIPIEEVKTCDLNLAAAVAAFIGLNMLEGTEVTLTNPGEYPLVLQTSYDPANLAFPQGWYFAKHSVRNKHHSTTGFYEEIPVKDDKGKLWQTYRVENARQVEGKDFGPLVLADVIVALNPHAKKLNPTVVKLTKLEKLESIKILEGWTVTVEHGKITLTSGYSKAFIIY